MSEAFGGVPENGLENLIQKLQRYKDELKSIENFMIEQLKDQNYLMNEFRLAMFARHFDEVFVRTNFFKKVEDSIKRKDLGELYFLIMDLEKQMSFFRMFKDKNWKPPT